MRLHSLAVIALTWPAAAIAQIVTLQNDSFVSGGNAVYQGGFIAGEMGASRLVPTGASMYRVMKVRFLYGPSTTTNAINLHVYDDSPLTDAPGTELYNVTYQVDGSSGSFAEIDVSGANIVVAGTFRVAIEFSAAGDPSIAADDGTIAADKNYIFAIPGGWSQSASQGLTGNWIIRCDVLLLGGDAGPVDAGTGMDAGGGTDAGVGPDAGPMDAGTSSDAGFGSDAGAGADGGNGVPCRVTSECPTGQYCFNKTSCTYDCRIDADCGGKNMRCTSTGQCESYAQSSGCSTQDREGASASVVAMLGGLTMLLRARRRPA